MAKSLWRCRIEFPGKRVPLPDGFAWPLSLADPPTRVIYEDAEHQKAVLDLYFEGKPKPAALERIRAVLAGATGADLPPLAAARLKERDWIAQSQKLARPVRAGRFFIVASHHKGRTPRGAIRLKVEAGLAFGTGRHETTRGCLIALSRLGARFRPGVALDLGCGTGILALAICRLWPRAQLTASDSDPRAVKAARATFALNRAKNIELVEDEGFSHPHLRERPFDLIAANLLADPLIILAGEMRKHCSETGKLVLAGLTAEQEAGVARAYAGRGFRVEEKIVLGKWPTLVMGCDPAGN